MLKSTDNTFTREQFVMLREARTLIEEQFETDFSLHSENIVLDVYEYAVRSDSNELFRLFTNLNKLSDNNLDYPLDEEQFILLREAKRLIEPEFHQELALVESDVMDSLYDFSLYSDSEALFDIYRYLRSRDRNAEIQDARVTGAYFIQIKRLLDLAQAEFGDEVPNSHKALIDALPFLTERSKEPNLVALIKEINEWKVKPAGGTELIFAELSAPVFEFLREAKHAIAEEFSEVFSLHTEDTMDVLYSYALKSEHEDLFDLFCDLYTAQSMTRTNARTPKDWINRDQFSVLRESRSAIRSEFGEIIELRSPQIQETLYQYSLRAQAEDLFGLCRDFHDLCAPNDRTMALPTKEEFRLLREARTLVNKEFSESLSLQSNVVEYDLYRFAVNSESDELFDLYTDLMALPDKLETTAFDDVPLLLNKDEFAKLREARRLVAEEFEEVLALEAADVLDELYRFALDSNGEALFDIHAELNAAAVDLPELQSTEGKVESKSGGLAATEASDSGSSTAKDAEEQNPEVRTDEQVAEEQVAEEQVVEEQVAEEQVTEEQVTEEQVAEEQVAEEQATEEISAQERVAAAPSKLRRIFGFGSKSEVVPASARVALSPQRDGPKIKLPEPEVVELSQAQAAALEPSDKGSTNGQLDAEGDTIEQAKPETSEQAQSTSGDANEEIEELKAVEMQKNAPEPAEETQEEHLDAPEVAVEAVAECVEEDVEEKLDSIQRAIQKDKGANKRRSAKKKSNRSGSRPKVSLPPVSAKAADNSEAWYLITDGGDLRVRILNELNISASGELLLVADDGDPVGAVIELSENGPTITSRAPGVMVNDEEVTDSQMLAANDKITVGDGVVRVEFSKIDQAVNAG